MDLEEALEQFGKALGNLKRAYAEEQGVNSNYVTVFVDESDWVTLIPVSREGSWIGAYRERVYTEEDSDNGV